MDFLQSLDDEQIKEYYENIKRKLEEPNNFLFLYILFEFISFANYSGEVTFPEGFRDYKRKLKKDISTRSDDIIGQSIDRLYLKDVKNNYKYTNKGFKEVFRLIENDIDERLFNYLESFSSEYIIVVFSVLSSILSKISISLDNSVLINPTNNLDLLIVILKSEANKSNDLRFDLRAFLGEIKHSLELLINKLILHGCNISTSSNYMNESDLSNIVFYASAIIKIETYKAGLNLLSYSERDSIQFTSKGIVFPRQSLEKFSLYLRDTEKEKMIISDPSIDIIDAYLQSVRRFDPKILDSYLSKRNTDKDKILKLEDGYLTIANKGVFENDLQKYEKIDRNIASQIVNNVTLNISEFKKIESAEDTLWHPNYRLFRSPLLSLKNIELIPTYTLKESATYFKLRILERDIFHQGKSREWNELLKKYYDERVLGELEKKIKDQVSVVKSNFILTKIPNEEIKKEIIQNHLTEEIDLVIIHQGTLYLYDLKNYGLSRNLKHAHKVIESKIKFELSKYKKLKELIQNYKSQFEEILGIFDDIQVGIITVNTTPYKYFKDNNVLSFPDIISDKVSLFNK